MTGSAFPACPCWAERPYYFVYAEQIGEGEVWTAMLRCTTSEPFLIEGRTINGAPRTARATGFQYPEELPCRWWSVKVHRYP